MARPPFGLSGVVDRADDLLAGRLDDVSGDLGDRPAVDGRGLAVEQAWALEQLAHHERDATRLVHVGRGEPAARAHVADERRPVGDRAELVDVERDAELVGDGQEVEHAVGRAAGRRHAGDAVLEGRPGHDRRRSDVASDEVHDELAGAVRSGVLRRILGRDAVQAGRRQPDELHDACSSCWPCTGRRRRPAPGRPRSRSRSARRG